MEKKYIYYPFMVLAMTVALSSCDDFLDEMPDNRTELDTEAKITSMLVSAYPETNYALLAEMSSDNADDNGGTPACSFCMPSLSLVSIRSCIPHVRTCSCAR